MVSKILIMSFWLVITVTPGCHKASGGDEDAGNSDSDSDSDTDSDADTDADTDSDSDSDTDSDTDGEIWGYVNVEFQQPAPGIQVTAISNTTWSSFGPVTSDEDGIYTFDSLPVDNYSLMAIYDFYEGEAHDIDLNPGESLQVDIELVEMTAEAPYIYLYPQIAQNVDVTLTPVSGTSIIASDPTYGSGWSVWAEPSGLIDGTYDYLFYESTVVWSFQELEGWAVPQYQLFQWFEDNLPNMGLNQQETDDFVDYWSVYLPSAPCYSIFPQPIATIEQNMLVDITPTPDAFLRLWLLIEGTPTCQTIAPPSSQTFNRTGFTAVEWGVIPNWNTF